MKINYPPKFQVCHTLVYYPTISGWKSENSSPPMCNIIISNPPWSYFITWYTIIPYNSPISELCILMSSGQEETGQIQILMIWLTYLMSASKEAIKVELTKCVCVLYWTVQTRRTLCGRLERKTKISSLETREKEIDWWTKEKRVRSPTQLALIHLGVK